MKKLVAGLLVLGVLACPVRTLAQRVEKAYGKMSVGAAIGTGLDLPLLYSVDIFYHPKFSMGVVGIMAGNSDFTRDVQGVPITFESRDITVFCGYWSNANKSRLLGWHGYFGIGISFVDVRSQKFTGINSYFNHNKFGLGLDLYLIRKGKEKVIPLALTLDTAILNRTVVVTPGAGQTIDVKSGIDNCSVLAGLRVWF